MSEENREPITMPEEMFQEFLDKHARVEGITRMCVLDNEIERLLRSVMIDGGAVDELMDDGPNSLSSFSMKIRIAYALGLIPEAVAKDLRWINKIRNEFAHNQEATSFDVSPIRDWCQELSEAKAYGRWLDPSLAHMCAVVRILAFLQHETTEREGAKAVEQRRQLDALQSRHDALAAELLPPSLRRPTV